MFSVKTCSMHESFDDRPSRFADNKVAREAIGESLRTAFPLPESGAFGDLLAALGQQVSEHR